MRQIWEQIERECGAGGALWDASTLEIARQVARGDEPVLLAPVQDEEAADVYARRLQAIQNRFPFLRFAPSDEQRYTQGIGENAYHLSDIVLVGNPRDDYWRGKESADWFRAPPLRPGSEVCVGDPGPALPPEPYRSLHQPPDDGATLHQALDRYCDWIRKHYFDVELNDLTEYGHTKIGQVETLKSRHEDVPLRQIDYDYIEGMYRFWRQRPLKNSRTERQERISHASLRHYIGELHRFFNPSSTVARWNLS